MGQDRRVNLGGSPLQVHEEQDFGDRRGERSPRRKRTLRKEQTPWHDRTPQQEQTPRHKGTLRLKGIINTIAMGICRWVLKLGQKVVLIDQGSLADILYMSTFRCLQISEAEIYPYHEQIVGFSGECMDTCEYINLFTTFGDHCALHTILVHYLLVEANTSYNVLTVARHGTPLVPEYLPHT
ncbi:hypothetical protein CR513_50906, partial [Mucuna pruriens]